MGAALQIQNPRQRLAVRIADVLLTPLGWASARPTSARSIRHILLLRLERIGDLLMTLDAIHAVREAWPEATIDIAVGSWNEALSGLIPEISRVHVVDVPWLSRGERETSSRALWHAARGWRRERYDMVINFEPDIRSNFLVWLSGAALRVGYGSGGGGALLNHHGQYDPSVHVSTNARRLVTDVAAPAGAGAARVTGRPGLALPSAARTRAQALIAGARRPLIGVHVSGGRESKQWHLDRFADVARRLADATSGTIVLTGGTSDVTMVDTTAALLEGTPVIRAAGTLPLPETAALLSELDVFVTGDTGPMHLASAVGIPIVALFGPSDPVRYGPNAAIERIVRVQIPCSPCGQVRLPPERCRGHVPDCMDAITVDAVVGHALELLNLHGVALTPTRS